MLGQQKRRTQASQLPERQLRRVDFSRKLARTIFVRRGKVRQVETLADAARVVAEFDELRPLRSTWDSVAYQLLKAAATGEQADVDLATTLLEQALKRSRR